MKANFSVLRVMGAGYQKAFVEYWTSFHRGNQVINVGWWDLTRPPPGWVKDGDPRLV